MSLTGTVAPGKGAELNLKHLPPISPGHVTARIVEAEGGSALVIELPAEDLDELKRGAGADGSVVVHVIAAKPKD